MEDQKILDEITRRIVEKFNPVRIILFGSRARGTADDKSDYDILVICPFKGKRRSFATDIDRSLRGMRIGRDIIVLTPEEFERDRHIPGTIARPSFAEGKVLYDHAE